MEPEFPALAQLRLGFWHEDKSHTPISQMPQHMVKSIAQQINLALLQGEYDPASCQRALAIVKEVADRRRINLVPKLCHCGKVGIHQMANSDQVRCNEHKSEALDLGYRALLSTKEDKRKKKKKERAT